ncbi:MAG: DUF5596 domain-containing protein [Clostridia bacterium]|nr:DUF5596 domain-containing protein [Clostridia bacterium]
MTETRSWPTDPVTGDSAKEFADKIGLPEEYFTAAEPLMPKIHELIKDKPFDEDLWDSDNLSEISKSIGAEHDLTNLAAGILIGMRAHAFYQEHGIGDDIYYPSMREITVWSKTCANVIGHLGLHEWGWVTCFFTAGIVRLGRLEFHEVDFHDTFTWEKNGFTVKGGDKVINTHIPEDGPLDPDAVIDSFRRAYRYFKKTGPAAFVCASWLLWPGNYEFLAPNSRIRAFMDNFDIISHDDSKNNWDLWRVFGFRDSYDPATLPRETDLQRRMADFLAKNDNVTGSGYGVFLFDGENIVR